MRARLPLAIAFALVVTPVLGVTAPPAHAGGGCHEQGIRESRYATEVALTKNCFSPTVIHVDPGATVTWANKDGVTHNVTGAGFTFGSDDFDAATFTYRFNTAGTFPYFCGLHPGMIGTVVVGDPLALTAPASGVSLPASRAATSRSQERAGSIDGIAIVLLVLFTMAVSGSAGFGLGRQRS